MTKSYVLRKHPTRAEMAAELGVSCRMLYNWARTVAYLNDDYDRGRAWLNHLASLTLEERRAAAEYLRERSYLTPTRELW
jgi:hypothetical protein